MHPESLSLVDAAGAIRRGELSPLEYATGLLARIDSIETQIRAWVTIDRDAVLAEARACETEARQKRFRGPLHGIPIGIKDVFYTKGLRTTMGSSLFNDFVPDSDARVVANLKRAGAIVLGKSVTTQFAYLDPGPTGNAWNPTHTPGGSSSGSAAAVASRMCPAATGSQTVGSIGRPASYNGIVAMMPTQQRVSAENVFPDAWSLDHMGAFARSVPDIELIFEAIAEGTVERLPRPKPIRIGVLRGFFYANASDEMRGSIDNLAVQLSHSGFDVDEAQLPEMFDMGPSILRTILRAEMAAAHQDLYTVSSNDYGPKIRAVVEIGSLVDSVSYLRAKRLRQIYKREMQKIFERFDAVISPGARGTAPEGLAATGDSIMQLPWALADFPTLSLPHAVGANGLPLGIQVTAAPFEEGMLLAIGKTLEDVISFPYL